MLHITNLIIIFLVLLNLAGLTATAVRFTSAYALARAGLVLTLCLILFFIEHFFGLGKLYGLWPITTLFSIYLIYRQRDYLIKTNFHWSEVTFFIAFLYSIAWRYAYPDINPTSERMTDLYFINNYLNGQTLPPQDKWHSPYNFDFYYAFMHYSAALMGRLFGLSGGMTYNLAYALIQSMTIALAWQFSLFMLANNKAKELTTSTLSIVPVLFRIINWIKKRWRPLLLTLAMTLGGTGFSTFIPLIVNEQAIHADQEGYINAIKSPSATRYIGGFEESWLNPEKSGNARTEIADIFSPRLTKEKSDRIQSGEAGWFEHITTVLMYPQISWQGTVEPNFETRELPAEVFSYQYYVGDYHPPIASFFLLLILITAIALLEHKPDNRPAQALMALTIPAMLTTNSWIFPVHVLLCLSWVFYRHWSGQKPNWALLVVSTVAGFILIQPFMTHFSDRSLSAPFKLVEEIDRTPTHQLIMLFWPLLLMAFAGFFDRANRKLYLSVTFSFLILLAFTELLYVDDPTGGKHVRTNSTMKWWGYVWVGELMLLGAMGLKSSSRWIQSTAVIALLGIMPYSEIVLKTLLLQHKANFGQLHGHAWLDSDPTMRDTIDLLQQLPDGLVLESADKMAYSKSGSMALFANKPLYFGWYNHLITWHGGGTHLGLKFDQTLELYRGDMVNALSWLIARDIRYISWMPRDNDRSGTDKPWAKVHEKIRSHYYWQPTYEHNGNNEGEVTNRVGLFVRK